MKRYLLGIVFLVIAVCSLLFLSQRKQRDITIRETLLTVTVDDRVNIPVEIADTPEKRTLGLSYRNSLPEDGGMLFIFETSGRYGFWMKGMNFPLDMIWIDDNHIVDIDENVPNWPSGTPDSELPHYSPEVPAKMILEVNGGFVERNRIEIGDKVDLSSNL